MSDNGMPSASEISTSTREDFQIPDDLRIVQLVVENVKRIEAAAISPTDEVTKIGGWNENGKSSLIDSIEYTLCGGRALPVEPLRRGARKGFSRVQIGSASTGVGLVAERHYTKKGDRLVVMLDGQDQPITAPQKLLDTLYNANAAQPDDFLDLKPKDKLVVLQKLLGVSFDDLDTKYAEIYRERTGVSREAKLLEGQIEGAEHYDDAPKDAIDTEELRDQVERATGHNQQVALREREVERRTMQAKSLLQQVEQYEQEIEALRKRAIELKAKQVELRSQAEALSEPQASEPLEPIDTAALLTQLQGAEETNRKVLSNQQRRKLQTEFRAKNAEVDRLTFALEALTEEKENRIAAAKFPVPGLSFSDDGVLLNGLPLEQASQEQQVIVAAGIALAQQPALRAILMRRGSLLDPKHQAILREWAKENKCQVFLEVVGKDADCQVIIENGLVEEGEANAA